MTHASTLSSCWRIRARFPPLPGSCARRSCRSAEVQESRLESQRLRLSGASGRPGLLCPATTARGFSDSIMSSAAIHSFLDSALDSPRWIPTESAAGQVARLVWSFPRCACARATLGAQSVRRPGCNAGPLGFYGRPQRAGPAQSPPHQDARVHHREVAPAPATSAKYTMPRNTSSGADHFRAVATMHI